MVFPLRTEGGATAIDVQGEAASFALSPSLGASVDPVRVVVAPPPVAAAPGLEPNKPGAGAVAPLFSEDASLSLPPKRLNGEAAAGVSFFSALSFLGGTALNNPPVGAADGVVPSLL